MRSLALIVPMFVSSMAHAAVVYTNGNWQLADSSTTQAPNGVCVASTGVRIGNTNWRLEFRINKNQPGPLAVMLTQKGRGATSWTTTLRDDTVLAFAAAGKEGTADTMWNVPHKTSSLTAQLEERYRVHFKPADGSRDVGLDFPSTGFRPVFERMKTRCRPNGDLLESAFQAALVGESPRPVNPAGITVETTAQLREIETRAHGLLRERATRSSESTALTARFQALLTESATLAATTTRLEGTDIPATRAAQAANDANEVRANEAVARADRELPPLEQDVVTTTATYQRVEAVIAPLRPEHDRLETIMVNARRESAAAEARIDAIDARLTSAASELRSAESELRAEESSARDLYTRHQQADSTWRARDAEARQSEATYRAFNPDYEMRRELSSDWQYRSAQNDVDYAERDEASAERDLRAARSEVSQYRSIRDSAQSALSACQATPEADCRDQEKVLIAANDKLARVKREEDAAESRVSSARSRVRDAEYRVRAIESNVASRIESRYRELSSRYQQDAREEAQARQVRDSLLADMQRAEARTRDLENFVIPRLRQEIVSLQTERPGVVSRRDRADAEDRSATAELVAYERRVGWDAKEEASNQANNVRYTAVQRRDAVVRQKQTALAAIATAQRTRATLAQELQQREAALATARARQTEVTATLVPYHEEKARLEQEVARLVQAFADEAAAFAARIP
jgi:hypothetical protein